MKLKTFGAVGGIIVVAVVVFTACGGSSDDDGTPSGATSDAGSDSAATDTNPASGDDTGAPGEGDCNTNEDCTAKLPPTTPPSCAIATCDTLQKKCHFKAKDADNDGHLAKNCSAATATIETGDDCDDTDPNTYPGAWDGPATDFDSGAGVESDRCDQKDNDCNGSPDDGKLTVDGGDKTCKCDPNKPLPCYEYANGTPISPSTLDNTNTPKGICKKGTRTCVAGIPSACSGAVGPEQSEQCDTLDHDCNGKSGNAGDIVATAPIWYKDTDNDNYGDKNTMPVQQCVSPAGLWKIQLPNTDCDDSDPQRNPGLAEVCDGKDNNCNNIIDEGVLLPFCSDADGDTYCTTNCVQACSAPPGYRAQGTCGAGTDCNDTAGSGANIHPSAFEYCGDGIDSNCVGGDSETYPNLSQSCTAGTFGICKRTGTFVCAAAKTSTQCNAVAGTVMPAGANKPSTDPLIDSSQARFGYDPRWDYNCNNTQEVVDVLYKGNFQIAACENTDAGRQEACHTLSETECEQGVLGSKEFTCAQAGGVFLDGPQLCGQLFSLVSCLWNFQGATGCNYLTGSLIANDSFVTCQ